MGKKHYWVGYHRESDTIEINVKDSSGARIDSWECNIKDKKTASKIMKILKSKYGFELEIPEKKSINSKDKDLSWLRDDTNPF